MKKVRVPRTGEWVYSRSIWAWPLVALLLVLVLAPTLADAQTRISPPGVSSSAALLLVAYLIMPSDSGVGARVCRDGFDAAKVGAVYAIECPCACTTCSWTYVKVSATERRAMDSGTMTLMNCHAVERAR